MYLKSWLAIKHWFCSHKFIGSLALVHKLEDIFSSFLNNKYFNFINLRLRWRYIISIRHFCIILNPSLKPCNQGITIIIKISCCVARVGKIIVPKLGINRILLGLFMWCLSIPGAHWPQIQMTGVNWLIILFQIKKNKHKTVV